jgi:hypothetical protein
MPTSSSTAAQSSIPRTARLFDAVLGEGRLAVLEMLLGGGAGLAKLWALQLRGGCVARLPAT